MIFNCNKLLALKNKIINIMKVKTKLFNKAFIQWKINKV